MSTVESKWKYCDFLENEEKARINEERKRMYQGEFRFKICVVNIINDGKVINDMEKLVELFRKDGDLTKDTSIIIKFPLSSNYSYDEFMIGMREENGIECVDWYFVMKVMVDVVLNMVESGGYFDCSDERDIYLHRYQRFKRYPEFAECKSFNWFVDEYLNYMYAFKYDRLKMEMKEKGFTKEIIEKVKELKEWAFMYGIKIAGGWWDH